MLLLGAVLAGAAFLWAPTSAQAAFQLRVFDGTNTVTVTDGGAGDSDATTGSIVVTTATLTSGGITGWSQINVTTVFSNKTSGDDFAMLELATSARSNANGPLTTLTIDVTDTAFSQPASSTNFVMTSKVVNTSVPGTETVQGFYDSTNSGNNAFSIPGQASTALQTVTSSGVDINPSSVLIIPGTSPFALTYRSVLTPTAHSQFFSTDNQLTVSVPEPSSVALLGCGVFGLIGYVRKRRKAAAL